MTQDQELRLEAMALAVALVSERMKTFQIPVAELIAIATSIYEFLVDEAVSGRPN